MYRNEQRGNTFRRSYDPQASRRNREDAALSIRKAKREEILIKRRQQMAGFQSADEQTQNKLKDVPQMVIAIKSDDVAQQLKATQMFRKLLSIERNPPISVIIKTGIVPRLVEFLCYDHNSLLQFEAAWVITNIASGTSEHTQEVVRANAIPNFVRLLSSPADDVRDQAVWALGNIAGDSTSSRDEVLNYGALPPLLNLLHTTTKINMLRNATWALSNLCRGKEPPEFSKVRPAIPTLSKLIQTCGDKDVLSDACWAISFLSEGVDNKIEVVVRQENLVNTLVTLLMNSSSLAVQTPALRTIGNIVTGTKEQTQTVINARALPYLLQLLSSPKKAIRKETCWAISNITAGTASQIQAVFDANLLQPLLELVRVAEFEIRKEAAWAICNATSGSLPHQIAFMVSQGCIPPLLELLDIADTRIVQIALEGIDNILKSGLSQAKNAGVDNPYVPYVEQAGGKDILEMLENHENKKVAAKARAILASFFVTDVIDLEPSTSGAQFTFGLNNSTDNYYL